MIFPCKVCYRDGELVTTEATDRVTKTHGRLQALRDFHEQGVTGGVTESIVDILEPIDVYEQHGYRQPVARRFDERVTQPIQVHAPVRQSRQGIELRHV